MDCVNGAKKCFDLKHKVLNLQTDGKCLYILTDSILYKYECVNGEIKGVAKANIKNKNQMTFIFIPFFEMKRRIC